MPRKLDPVEAEYEEALRYAHDTDEAMELSIGLKQYREMFRELQWDWDRDVLS